MEFLDIEALVGSLGDFDAARNMVCEYLQNWFGVVRLINLLAEEAVEKADLGKQVEEEKKSDWNLQRDGRPQYGRGKYFRGRARLDGAQRQLRKENKSSESKN